MKVNGISLPPTTQTEQSKSSNKVQSNDTAGAKKSDPAVVTHLSNAMKDTSQDINTARVDEVREAIREGNLNINPEKIADGLIQSVQDMLDSDQS